MKARLHRLEIRNFKAFREFTFDLEGRHLLVYGPNGSGKSSLYWALYTFVQSGRKPTSDVAKWFNAANPQTLLNIHEQGGGSPIPGEIALTLRDIATKNDTTYRISHTIHDTHQQPTILKGALASDFITYRFFFGFSHFRNAETFNLWPLFEKEILPFCVSTGGEVPLDRWLKIRDGIPNPHNYSGQAGADAFNNFHQNTAAFAAQLTSVVDSISNEAQQFYDQHFASDDETKMVLKLGVTTPPSSSGSNQGTFSFTIPIIELGTKVGGKTVQPQVFLNEAKLTQLALSVRFAASLINLHESDLKLLVLDDLLVSLDMSNRMKVVELLMSKTFSNYQKIILTHDLGFFRECRRRIGTGHPDWCFQRFEGTAADKIEAKNEKTDIQKAEGYIHGHDLDEAALCLRKACEETVRRFLGRDNAVDPTRGFTRLREDLRAARNRILGELPADLYEKVLKSTPTAHLDLLISATDDDIDGNGILDAPTKGILKTQRKRFRELLKAEHVDRLRQITLIDSVLACTERVLNPAAHSGTPPLYEKEVQEALGLIKQLDATLRL